MEKYKEIDEARARLLAYCMCAISGGVAGFIIGYLVGHFHVLGL